ncbi:MAG: hypothetical protein JRJ51_26255, partial [Deltaproteobacteria bacterium]|nr:hypothetical protein [Deltaproteobacteria bacterium]
MGETIERLERVEKNRIIEFEAEGVIFILPRELDNVYIRREKFTDSDNIDGDVKEPRTVIRVSLLEIGEKNSEKELLDAELTLIVYYNYDDVLRAKKKDRDEPLLIIGEEDEEYMFEGFSAIYQTVSGSKKWLGYVMVKMNRSG